MDDELLERIQNGSEAEKQNILKEFNIIEIKAKPNKNIVEVDLDDGDSDTNRNIEDEDEDDDIQILEGSLDDEEVSEQEVRTENIRVRGDLAPVNQQEEEEDDDEIVIL